MKTRTYFITGTDTEIGKTYCALAFIAALRGRGLRTAAMKPAASGCFATPAGLRNEDALLLQEQADVQAAYELINPYAFAPPIAPHLAAREAARDIDMRVILQAHEKLRAQADVLVVEGAGGWRVPLNETQDWSDLARALEARVILVVGIRLGCINHALLSVEAVLGDGLDLAGWFANHIDPNFEPEGSIDTLRARIQAPLLASFPYTPEKPLSVSIKLPL